jgi:hypothetical protein
LQKQAWGPAEVPDSDFTDLDFAAAAAAAAVTTFLRLVFAACTNVTFSETSKRGQRHQPEAEVPRRDGGSRRLRSLVGGTRARREMTTDNTLFMCTSESQVGERVMRKLWRARDGSGAFAIWRHPDKLKLKIS